MSYLRGSTGVRSLLAVAISVSLIAAISLSATAQETSLEAKVDEYLAPYLEMGNFCGVVLIGQGDEVLLCKGYGTADYEKGTPVTPRSRFQIGSLGKQFTAACIMQLVEQGRLRVEDPLSNYISDYKEAGRITIHNLLCHTSGLPMDFPEDGGEGGFRERLNRQELLFEPGSQYNYSNVGYRLLYLLTYVGSGINPDQYLRENIFERLGMTSTVFDEGNEIPDAAVGYMLQFGGPANVENYVGRQIGATYSTAEDMFAWVRGFVGGKVVGAASREKMLTPNLAGYGYAWFIEEREGGPLISHGGRMPGFSCNLKHMVGSGVTVIVMSNIANTPMRRISADMLAIASGGEYVIPKAYHAITVDINALTGAVGTYRADDGTKLIVSLAPEFIVLTYVPEGSTASREELPWYTLYPMAKDRYFCKDFDGQLEFRAFVDGKAQVLRFIYNGEEDDYRRVGQ